MNYFRRLRDTAISIALIAIPFFFLRSNLKDSGQLSWLDRLILEVSAPIQHAAVYTARGVSGLLEDYVELVDVRRDNERLRAEAARLRSDNRALIMQARDNRRLRELLQLRETFGGEVLSAQVIGKESSPFFRVLRIRIDRGDRDRIRPGMPVIATEGLVGHIRRTWGRYSDVELTVSRISAVDVVIERTGARGVLRGTGEQNRYLARIEYLRRTDEVQAGDAVYTSGLGERYPPSLLVGSITRVDRKAHGLYYQEVEVDPAVNFSRLREVLVLTTGSEQGTLVEGNAQDTRP